MRFHACYASELDQAELVVQRLDEAHELVFPVITPGHIDAIADRLLAAGAALRTMPVARIVQAIDRAAALLANPEHELGRIARALIPLTTSYSATMVDHVLTRMTADWRAPALEKLLASELGDPAVLDGFTGDLNGRRVTALGPALTTHIFSGNVPGVAVTSLVRALLVKSPSIGKTAHDEPVLPVLFARALESGDPDLASALAIVNWSGGAEALEARAFARSDLIVVYGDRRTAHSIGQRAQTRVVTHGPRASIGIVHAAAAHGPAVISAAARAVATFDQQGCVSPHMIFVLTPDPELALTFARDLAQELERLEQELPRGRLTVAEAAAFRAACTAAEFQSIAGKGGCLFVAPTAAVVLLGEPRFEISCLNRVVYVTHVPDAQHMIDLLRPHGQLLQSVALEGFDDPDATALALQLGRLGATRITSFARLPWPPAEWHHDGGAPLRELLTWVDWEPGLDF